MNDKDWHSAALEATELPAGLFSDDQNVHRCVWCRATDVYQRYHDHEWGFPVSDDRRLFEKVFLEGFQAGLSWLTILNKREAFTTQDINRCQTTARVGALVYNWWSWYCRAAHPGARLEAVTSRPLLLAAIGKAANHGGQMQLYLTPLHGKVQTIKALVVNIRTALQHVKSIAEQLPTVDRWATLLRYICQRFAPTIATYMPQTALAGSG